MVKIPDEIRGLVSDAIRKLKEKYRDRLVSTVLYGSWARGEQKPTSDVDLLVILEGPFRFVQARREIYLLVNSPVAQVQISPLVLESSQAMRLQPIHFELYADGKILYDKGNFMKNILQRVGEIIRNLGSERYRTRDGCYGWVLKKQMSPGEVIEVEL